MRTSIIAIALAAFVAAPAAAQSVAPPALPQAEAVPQGGLGTLDPSVAALPYHNFDGMDVVSVTGETIGEIERVYRRGDEYYARMNIGGDWFDIIKEEVMVPLSSFRVEGEQLSLPITEAQAEALEEWSEGDYEQMAEDLDIGTMGELYD